MKINRTDKSILGQWWWTIDRWGLTAVFAMILFGIVLVTAASPSVAVRIGLEPFHFVYRHLIFLIPTILLIFGISLMNRRMLWRLSSLMFAGSILLIMATLIFGDEVKGASRWIYLFGFSLQPSEFLKPAYAVTGAWLIAKQHQNENFPGVKIATGLLLLGLTLLLMQPDLGMSIVLASIWGVHIFLSGLSFVFIIALILFGCIALIMAYLFFPHVSSRINRFLDPASGDNYQINNSLSAFQNGGLFGTGPGQGEIKTRLPDAHADFIFSVAGEELGLIMTLMLVGLFAFFVIRCINRVLHNRDLFVILATGGLVTQFALQSLIHMGSSLRLLPAKGMTLPFISYGGSSLLALGISTGLLLALTRRRITYVKPHTPRQKD